MARWPFRGVEPGTIRTILADPPWHFRTYSAKGEGKSASQHYRTMSIGDIQALPVRALAHPEGCALVLWFSSPFLVAAMDTLACWGFEYRAMGAWTKQSPTGRSLHLGTGYWYRSAAEFWLLGTRGQVRRQHRGIRNAILAPVREHSRKPAQMIEDTERFLPGPHMELFARTRRTGWRSWGANTGRFKEDTNG